MVSKANFSKFQIYSSQEHRSLFHGSFGTNKPRKCYMSSYCNSINHYYVLGWCNAVQDKNSSFRGEGFSNDCACRKKIEEQNNGPILLDVNDVGQKWVVDPFICLSWVSSRTNSSRSILQRDLATSMRVVLLAKKYKGLRYTHPIST